MAYDPTIEADPVTSHLYENLPPTTRQVKFASSGNFFARLAIIRHTEDRSIVSLFPRASDHTAKAISQHRRTKICVLRSYEQPRRNIAPFLAGPPDLTARHTSYYRRAAKHCLAILRYSLHRNIVGPRESSPDLTTSRKIGASIICCPILRLVVRSGAIKTSAAILRQRSGCERADPSTMGGQSKTNVS